MFSIGFLELCVIAVGALIFFGPQRLPEIMKQLGRFFVQARRISSEVKSAMDTVMHEAEKSVQREEEDRQSAARARGEKKAYPPAPAKPEIKPESADADAEITLTPPNAVSSETKTLH